MRDFLFAIKSRSKNKVKIESLSIFGTFININSLNILTIFLLNIWITSLIVDLTIGKAEQIDKKVAIGFLGYFL